jgi:hypothetical protein
MKWEYREAYIYGLEDTIQQLNELGKEGWEFCFKYNGVIIILKRAMPEQAASIKTQIAVEGFPEVEKSLKQCLTCLQQLTMKVHNL